MRWLLSVQWLGLVRVSVSTRTAPPPALASLRRFKLRHSKSHAWFTHFLRNHCPTQTKQYHPCHTKLSARARWLRRYQSWQNLGLPRIRRSFIRGRGQSTTGSMTSPLGMSWERCSTMSRPIKRMRSTDCTISSCQAVIAHREDADARTSEMARAQSALHVKSHRLSKHPPFECIALLFQGGGALGSYQAGAYESLVETNLHSRLGSRDFDWRAQFCDHCRKCPRRASREGAYLPAGDYCEPVFGWTAGDRWSPK